MTILAPYMTSMVNSKLSKNIFFVFSVSRASIWYIEWPIFKNFFFDQYVSVMVAHKDTHKVNRSGKYVSLLIRPRGIQIFLPFVSTTFGSSIKSVYGRTDGHDLRNISICIKWVYITYHRPKKHRDNPKKIFILSGSVKL